jgi:glycosyltransferase involved in cell wall biosynthesis
MHPESPAGFADRQNLVIERDNLRAQFCRHGWKLSRTWHKASSSGLKVLKSIRHIALKVNVYFDRFRCGTACPCVVNIWHNLLSNKDLGIAVT